MALLNCSVPLELAFTLVNGAGMNVQADDTPTKNGWGRVGLRWKNDRAMMLVSTPEEALALYEAGSPVKSVNLGGLHFRNGRLQVMKGISLDEQDVRALKKLASKGIVLEARALPLDEPFDMAHYLERWQEERDALREQPR